MKILVVEDDQVVAHTLQLLLSRYNYAVDIAIDGEAGLELANAFNYDLVLLDVILPKLDGISLCQQLRTKGFPSPILLVTGQGEGHQKAIALNAGADDYVVKPFDAEELIARVQALLRRGGRINQPILVWGDLAIDPAHRKVSYGNHLLTLTPKEYAILELFLRNSRTVLSLRVILDRVWTSVEFPSEEAVRVHIKEIRQKLKAVGAPKDLIKTKHGMGYQLNPLYVPNLPNLGVTNLPEVAELNAVNTELRLTLEELRSTQAVLQRKNQELEASYQALAQERQQLQEARDQLKQKMADRATRLRMLNRLLRQEREQWQALFEHALEAILIADDAGYYIDANPAACKLFGLSRKRLLLAHMADFADPELDANQIWQQFLQQGQMAGEFRLHCPNGTIKDTELNAIANFLPKRHLLTWRDITDRKQAEAQIQFSQAKFEALLANMPGMVYRYFPHTPEKLHHFNFVSQYSTQLLELDPEAIIQDVNSFLNLIHPEDLQSFTESVFQSVEHFLSWHWEGRIVTPSGQLKWIQGSSQAQNTLEGQAWDGLLVDVSNQKFAEQKIREQAALLDIASDAIFVRDLNNRILYWNQGAEQLYGWSAAEAIGQLANQLLQDQESFLEVVWQNLLLQNEWQGEIHNTTKTGRQVTVATRLTLVRDESRQPKCILTVDTDISEKRQLEAQFYRTQRLESLGTLASGIAHNLNNVLTPIVAISQLLQLQRFVADAQARQMLQLLEESGKRGAAMIKQLLTFARGTGGDRQLVAIATLLQEVLNVIQQTFPKSISIDHNFSNAANLAVHADPTYLHQVFMNLCINARDAMPQGGTIALTIEPYVVDQTFAAAHLEAQVGHYVMVTVADTGTGIPPEVSDYIFEPFFTTKPQGQGTGLGLATVLGIVKDYGGFLQVISEVGRGTQMRIYLPLAEAAFSHANSPQLQLAGQGELVLLVDDDAAIQFSVKMLLENHHYRVISANGGVEAIDLYQQHQAEISWIILDIMMPDMDGISLMPQLKEINSAAKMIAVSGLPTNRESALAAGANAFLPKPYTIEELLQALQDFN